MSSQQEARRTPDANDTLSIAEGVQGLDELVSRAMDEWHVPGVAIAIVRGSEPAFLKTYGYRDPDARLPVTTATQFTICSITKSFTATAIAALADEERLDWTKPVRDYLPEFRLHDSAATERITVRDLLCHHSGLPRHDWIWMPADLSSGEMLAAMRHLEPSHDLRDTWQYNNLGYHAAGVLIERVTGKPYAEVVREKLIDRLGMTVSFAAEEIAAAADAAVPYMIDVERPVRSGFYPIRTTAAGAINTSIADFTKWLRLHLGDGEVDGQRLVSATRIRQLRQPRAFVASSQYAEYGATHYGLGLQTTRYRGDRTIGHGGGWIGWNTVMTFLPKRGFGIAVFTNRSPNAVPLIATNYLLDRLCGRDPVPWLDRLTAERREFVAKIEQDKQARQRARHANTTPSHALADYVADYEHPAYGRMAITRDGDALHWAWRGMAAALTHRHYDTFELPEVNDRLLPNNLAISFTTDRDGNIASLAAPLEPMVKDIVFTRCAGGDCLDPAFRGSCVGNYRSGATTHRVTLDTNGQLLLKPDHQPTYRLRPYQGRTFSLGDFEGFRVEFKRAATGDTIEEIVFHQPNGIFFAQRIAGEGG
jgi:CubicO group peptidase (beta-lactamase class C family)